MFDHVSIEVSDLKNSKKFYTEALKPLGYGLVMDLEEYNAAGFGKDRPQLWIGGGSPKSADDEVHICLVANSRKSVQEFYDAAIKAGGRDNGKPGLRPEYGANYFAAFVLDLDGYNIEACCRAPE